MTLSNRRGIRKENVQFPIICHHIMQPVPLCQPPFSGTDFQITVQDCSLRVNPLILLPITYLPSFNVRLPLLKKFQLLHLPFGLIDIGTHSLHCLQRVLDCWIIWMFHGRPLGQFLEKDCKKEGKEKEKSKLQRVSYNSFHWLEEVWDAHEGQSGILLDHMYFKSARQSINVKGHATNSKTLTLDA